MKINKIAIVIVSLFAAPLAHAQYYWFGPAGVGPYFRADIGPTFFQDGEIKGYNVSGTFNDPPGRVNYNVGASADGAFGWAFNKYVSLDGEFGYIWGSLNNAQNYDPNGSTLDNAPFLANVILSLPIPHSNIVPYIGGGLGGSDSIFDAHHFTDPAGNYADGSESDVVFAWQVVAGVRFMLTPNFSLGVGYQFFATGNPTFSYPPYPNLNAEFQGVRTHSIMFSLRANF
ncbi:MAG: outer membrane protein [Limisphaerales bacterium]